MWVGGGVGVATAASGRGGGGKQGRGRRGGRWRHSMVCRQQRRRQGVGRVVRGVWCVVSGVVSVSVGAGQQAGTQGRHHRPSAMMAWNQPPKLQRSAGPPRATARELGVGWAAATPPTACSNTGREEDEANMMGDTVFPFAMVKVSRRGRSETRRQAMCLCRWTCLRRQPSWSTSRLTRTCNSPSRPLALHLPFARCPTAPSAHRPHVPPACLLAGWLAVRLPKQRRRQDRRRRQGPRALANPFGAAANVPQIS
jgi:hypothetical protein